MKSFFYDLLVPTLLADAKNWRDVQYCHSTLITGNWGRYSFRLNPGAQTIAIDDDAGFWAGLREAPPERPGALHESTEP